jgi:thiol-disulfide isomerase/thioredoxin
MTMTRRGVLLAAAAAPLASWSEPAPVAVKRASPALPVVMDFDQTTWAELLKSGPRPAAYVFTTTYCPTCPDAFDKLQTFIAASRKKVELVVVVMDVQGARALAHAHHYVGASRLYAFDGFEPAIRQSVDPKWPNVTPYIVLLGRNGSVQRSIGPPEAAMLKRWLV